MPGFAVVGSYCMVILPESLPSILIAVLQILIARIQWQQPTFLVCARYGVCALLMQINLYWMHEDLPCIRKYFVKVSHTWLPSLSSQASHYLLDTVLPAIVGELQSV
jgi:hypothetical protein